MNKNNIQLLHGPCLNLMSFVSSKSINLILCDLPYGSTRNKFDNIIPFEPLWEQYTRVIKKNGAVILFGQGLFSAKLILSNEKMYRYSLIWEKSSPTGFLNANRMPLRSHEDIILFYNKLPTYNPQKTIGHVRKTSNNRNIKSFNNYNEYGLASYDSTERYPRSVLRFSSDKQKEHYHPQQKPVDLLVYLIKTYTNEGDTVLDNCMGSGSTGVACINTGRKFIGIEKEKIYYNIACGRVDKCLK